MSNLFSERSLMVSKLSSLLLDMNVTCHSSEQSLVGQRLCISSYIFEPNLGIRHVHWLIVLSGY